MIFINKYDTICDVNAIVNEAIVNNYSNYIIRIIYDTDKIKDYNLNTFLDGACCNDDIIMNVIYMISNYKIANINNISIINIDDTI
jgi:hypothetical protein